MEFANRFHLFVRRVHLNIVVVHLTSRVKSHYCAALNTLVVNQISEHHLSVVEKLLCLSTNGLVLENFRVAPVWVLTSDLPGHEERVPVDIGQYKLEIEVFVYTSA